MMLILQNHWSPISLPLFFNRVKVILPVKCIFPSSLPVDNSFCLSAFRSKTDKALDLRHFNIRIESIWKFLFVKINYIT